MIRQAVNEVGRALTSCTARLDVATQDKCGALLFLK